MAYSLPATPCVARVAEDSREEGLHAQSISAEAHAHSNSGTEDVVPGARTALQGDDEPESIPVVTGGPRDVPGPVESVVHVEGAVETPPDDAAVEERVRALSFSPEGRPVEVDLTEIGELVQRDEHFVWIDLCDAPRALQTLASTLRLSRAEVHAAMSPWRRPELDVAGERFLVAVTLPQTDAAERRMVASRLNLFVGRNYLITFHQTPLPFDEVLLARVRLNPELPRLDSAYMLYLILDQLLEYYEGLADEADEEIEHMELKALVEADDAFLGELLALKRYVYGLVRLAEHHRQVFEAFRRPEFPFVAGEEVSSYFRDLEGRLHRTLDTLSAEKDGVTGAFDIYVSRVSHETNRVMKVLTVVSSLLLPIAVILAFFGTSFKSVSAIYSIAGFIVMIALVIAVLTSLIVTFRRLGWF